jgi:hypothetical protein
VTSRRVRVSATSLQVAARSNAGCASSSSAATLSFSLARITISLRSLACCSISKPLSPASATLAFELRIELKRTRITGTAASTLAV